MAAEDTSIHSLEHTPTWALATVCFVFISVSIVLEHIFHLLTNWLNRSRRTALGEAADKLKSELMLLGFMSLMLAATQKPISKICIPAHLANSMLPCRKLSKLAAVQNYGNLAGNFVGSLSLENGLRGKNILWGHRSLLADDDGGNISDDPCSSKGKVSLISEKGIHQLHIFIFVLAVMQIFYSVLTMALGWTKMRRWEAWEKESRTTEYQVANDPNRFRLTRQTTFGRRHIETWANISPLLWMICFFRQFFHSVAKVDYLTLRHGFISAHLSTRNVNHFNFQEYIQRSLDDDFKVVIGISPLMWFMVAIFLLLDVRGKYSLPFIFCIHLIYASFSLQLYISSHAIFFFSGMFRLECISLDFLCSTRADKIVLVVGAKLEVIVAKMAFRIDDKSCVSRGTPLVQPNDNLFWFGQPRFVLVLIHFVLFVNAFEFAFFIWVAIQFGLESCYHENTAFIVTRVVLAYITLPLYALVTQMGSQFKSKVLEEQVAHIIKERHAEARERGKKQDQYSLRSPRSALSTDRSIKMYSPIRSPRPPILHELTLPSNEQQIAAKDNEKRSPLIH
ncbi:hypothetical protein NC652_016590 [Populus alba x Populus x berolinensis]|nr:hypothetical protein NC652_016590 [Populus alba x Populus x berolinensis]